MINIGERVIAQRTEELMTEWTSKDIRTAVDYSLSWLEGDMKGTQRAIARSIRRGALNASAADLLAKDISGTFSPAFEDPLVRDASAMERAVWLEESIKQMIEGKSPFLKEP
jgi:hypothetical protein